MMKHLIRNALLLLALTSVAGCNTSEDDFLPPYRQELCEATVDATGIVSSVRLDDGTLYTPGNQYAVQFRDTLIRAYAMFQADGDGMQLTRIAPVPTLRPYPAGAFPMKTDPLGLRAFWRGGRYANLLLAFPTGGNMAAHTVGIVETELRTRPDGGRTLHLSLYHDQGDDAAYYTRETYLSILLDSYAEPLTSGDSIALTANEHNGERTLVIPF